MSSWLRFSCEKFCTVLSRFHFFSTHTKRYEIGAAKNRKRNDATFCVGNIATETRRNVLLEIDFQTALRSRFSEISVILKTRRSDTKLRPNWNDTEVRLLQINPKRNDTTVFLEKSQPKLKYIAAKFVFRAALSNKHICFVCLAYRYTASYILLVVISSYLIHALQVFTLFFYPTWLTYRSKNCSQGKRIKFLSKW